MKEEKIRYRYIEHPSDVGFEAYGNTLEELFANAAIATYSFMTNVEEIGEEIERKVEIKSEDLYSLMFDWLDEMIFIFESEELIFKKFNITLDESNFIIKGKCKGEKFDPSKHEVGIIRIT
jgi:SHS2 domain-containing protein